MKRTLVAWAALLGSLAQGAVVIDQVSVRQQWPWSTDVKISYRIAGIDPAAPVDVNVTARNGSVALDGGKIADALSGDVYGIAEDGKKAILLDPVKAFGTDRPALGAFNVTLTASASAGGLGEVLYKIVDLDTGAVTDVTRGDLYNRRYGSYETQYGKVGGGFTTTLDDVIVWTGVTNRQEYMTSKMVFRKIKAKDVVWQMGETDPDVGSNARYQNEPFWAKLDADYFIGVFQVTQAQFDKFRHDDKAGHWGNYFTDETTYPDHLIYPVAGMSMGDVIRSGEAYTYLERMKAKCKLDVNLPTEAQWEFACRGGVYATCIYSGKAYNAAFIKELSWCQDNADGKMHPVNTKYPNAYGLYGMLGNAGEYCLNRQFSYSTETTEENPVVNPGSDAKTGNFVYRGGTYGQSRIFTISAYRSIITGSELWHNYGAIGFRVCFPAP